MRFSRCNLAVGCAAILFCALVIMNTSGSRAQEPEGNFGVGIPSVFLPKYLNYRTQQLNSGTPHVMRIRLGYVKGLSTNFTKMVGEAAINLQSGAFNVSLNGLTPLKTYTVWLVDQTEVDSIPPVPDTVVGLVTFLATGATSLLNGLLPVSLPPGFTIDRVAVVPGALPGTGPLASGSVNVFQMIFFRRLSLVNESTGVTLFQETTPAPALAALVPDVAAQAGSQLPLMGSLQGPRTLGFAMPASQIETSASSQSSGGSAALDKLISKGAKLFFEETFSGNGRTCGTCHPANNNFTIDKKFIETLPNNDPLFVAEFNQALFGLERPALMRSDGLILENVDGLENSNVKFVMRGVPHTLGLGVSLERDTGNVPAPPPEEMTGWSGDGAPGAGSLRDFANGAVTQHFTKSLNRFVGQDFKLPKPNQLTAMEAFQLSLGREADRKLAGLTFTDADATAGKGLFINGGGDPDFPGTCNFCHNDGGALSVIAGLKQNRNFNTNVEGRQHPSRPGDPDDDPDPNFPFDGGFGKAEPDPNPRNVFGNGTFNTASVVEAADTAPFFHNNVEVTLFEAVKFYSGTEFNAVAAAKIFFNDTQNGQITDFLIGINTLQNIDVAQRELKEILNNNNNPRSEQDKRLQTAFEETQDAIEVLSASGLFTIAKGHIVTAQQRISQAQLNPNPAQRRQLVQEALISLCTAEGSVLTSGTTCP